MKRRAFVGALAASAVGCSLAGRFPHRQRRLKRVGLELYSVRAEMKKDPEGTLAQVRAMGYDDVELLWAWDNFGRTDAQVRTALANTGLRAPSAHIDPSLLVGDWERSLARARLLGHDSLIVPSLPAETNSSLDAWKTWADHFNRAGAEARKAGIWLAFHNEPNHMTAIAGAVPYDVFLERTDASVVRLQLDTGNMRLGGGDPMRYLKQHVNRYWSFHLKDVVADGSRDTELGAGTVDFGAILATVPDIDAKPCIVEQEGSANPLESARRNQEYLRALQF